MCTGGRCRRNDGGGSDCDASWTVTFRETCPRCGSPIAVRRGWRLVFGGSHCMSPFFLYEAGDGSPRSIRTLLKSGEVGSIGLTSFIVEIAGALVSPRMSTPSCDRPRGRTMAGAVVCLKPFRRVCAGIRGWAIEKNRRRHSARSERRRNSHVQTADGREGGKK